MHQVNKQVMQWNWRHCTICQDCCNAVLKFRFAIDWRGTHQKGRLGEGKYPSSKTKRTQKAVKTIRHIPENAASNAVSPLPDVQILKQLKENFWRYNGFKNFEGNNFNYSPYDLYYLESSTSFPSCLYLHDKAKQFVTDKGIMSSPNLKPGKTLKKLLLKF
jgi:hypothetical protein